MGKKSSKKKPVRKLVEEKQEKEKGKKGILTKKKSKKELKKEAQKEVSKNHKKSFTSLFKSDSKKKKKKKSKKKKINIPKQQIFIAALVIIMLTILISTGFFLFSKAFRATPVAHYLPAENTVLTIEFNVDTNHKQMQQALELLDIRVPNILNLNNLSWIGRQAGVSILSYEDSLHTIYFAEISQQAGSQKFMEENPDSHRLGDYIFIAEDNQGIAALKALADKEPVSKTEKYIKIRNNLPFNRFGFLYLNFDLIDDNFFKNFPALSQRGLSKSLLDPFLKLFDAEGISFIALEDRFALQSFLSLNTNGLKNNSYIHLSKKYRAELSKFISPDVLFFWGGQNVEHQLNRLFEVLSLGRSSKFAFMEELLNTSIQKYFGDDVNLKDDILSLLSDEFAFAVEGNAKNKIYKVLIELDSPKADAERLKSLADSFSAAGAFFQTKVVPYTLPDGTQSREIVAVPEEILQQEDTYKEHVIHSMTMKKRKFAIHYTIKDNLAIISNNIDSLKQSIDLEQGTDSLMNSELFATNIEPILRSSDAISYLNLEVLLEDLFEDEKMIELLKPFSAITSGKNYFNDGISSINYLNLRENEEKAQGHSSKRSTYAY
ncbi:hypothetical protein JKY72_06740 [Candidatus Gracilibacteria bacterium]|nr:hypothetical protein [Candidatus Gracilibacteria bacterium]